MNKKVALIGSGNAFFKDEGIGLYAAKYLKENYIFNPELEIVDGGTLGFLLMPLLQEYEKVIIANTASDEAVDVGTITIKTTDEFLDGSLVKKTANEVEIAEMLQICALSEAMANTVVISIAPKDIMSVEVGLTSELKAAWENYIEAILEILQESGITYYKKENPLSIEEVLTIFENPSIEHKRGF
jgi:hydrogenase maturation protease